MATADGYEVYDQGHSYAHFPGTVVSPSGSRTGAARLLRLHGPYGTRSVHFDALRVGMPPVLPAAADTDGDTYMGGTVTLPLPGVNKRDGNYTFAASGNYLYLQNTVRVPGTDPLPTGSYPFGVNPQDYIAFVRLQQGDLAAEFEAALADPNPSQAVTVLAGANIYDDDNPQQGWYLTALPSEAFTTTLISG